jgi:hypothetical protein
LTASSACFKAGIAFSRAVLQVAASASAAFFCSLVLIYSSLAFACSSSAKAD